MEDVDPDSDAYRFGELMVLLGFLGVGLWLLIWGFTERTGPKKSAGQIKMAVGGGLVLLGLMTGLTSLMPAT